MHLLRGGRGHSHAHGGCPHSHGSGQGCGSKAGAASDGLGWLHEVSLGRAIPSLPTSPGAAAAGPDGSAGPGQASMDDVEQIDAFSAIRLGWLDRVKEILEGPGGAEALAAVSPGEGATLLHWAALFGAGDIVDYLITAGLDVESPTHHESASKPLHWACAKSQLASIHVLLAHGANIDCRDSVLHTPLTKAAIAGKVKLTAYLLGRGATRDAHDKDGASALHWAAKTGQTEVLRLLIGAGVDVNARDFHGNGAVHRAVEAGVPSAVATLVDAGSDYRGKNNLGLTPLDLAISLGADYRGVAGYLFNRVNRRWWHAYFFDERNNSYAWFGYVLVAMGFGYPIYFSRCFTMDGDGSGAGPLGSYTHPVFILAEIAMWAVFFGMKGRDPGFFKGSSKEYEEVLRKFSQATDASSMATDDSLDRLCHTCHHVRPPRSKHCNVSNECVILFDHYCPFLLCCIGAKTRPRFYLILIWLVIGRYILATYAWREWTAEGAEADWKVKLFWALMVLNVVFTATLLGLQSYLMLTNLTTNEFLNWEKYSNLQDDDGKFQNRNHKGLVRNVVAYWQSPRLAAQVTSSSRRRTPLHV